MDEIEKRALVISRAFKIGWHAILGEDFARRLAADDATLADPALLDRLPVALAPEFARQFPDLFVALRIVLQARVPLGPRSNHDRAGFDQFLDLLQNLHRHAVAIGQDQHAVAHPVGQHEPTVLNAHARQQHLRVADVVIVALSQQRVDVLGHNQIGRSIAVVVEHIRREQAARQQPLAARNVIGPGSRLLPPSDVRIEMRARKILVARLAVLGTSAGRGVMHEAVDSFTEGDVGRRFEFGRSFLPVRPDTGECFGHHPTLAVDVGSGGRLLAIGVLIGPFARVTRLPELAHRNVTVSEILQRVHRHDLGPTRSAGLGMDADATSAGQFGETGIVILRQTIGDGLAQVVQEAVGDLGTAHRVAGQHRQVRSGIVTAVLLKLVEEISRPIGQANFPTIIVQVLE